MAQDFHLVESTTPVPLFAVATVGRVPAYASMIQLSTPEERARMAVAIKSQAWKAIKLRAHYQTLKEDVRLVEAVRKAVGDGMDIMVDANQAQSSGAWQPGVMWDFRRALETARELERLNCLWLEEPRLRYAFDELAGLNRLAPSPSSTPSPPGRTHRGPRSCTTRPSPPIPMGSRFWGTRRWWTARAT
jgi:L-alanine-DL-glutamate epimerase-like enolase superfamily enzyme